MDIDTFLKTRKISRVLGDGNCYWRAIGINLHMDYKDVKKVVSEYMTNNVRKCEDIRAFLESSETTANDMHEYVQQHVLADGVHGGNQLDLFATANAFQANVFVHQLANTNNVTSFTVQSDQNHTIEIHVFYSPNHYDAVVDKKKNVQQICYIGAINETTNDAVYILNPYEFQNVNMKQLFLNMVNSQFSAIVFNLFSYNCEPIVVHQMLYYIGTNIISKNLPNHFTIFIPKDDSPLVHRREVGELIILEHYLLLSKWQQTYIRIGKESRIISVWNSATRKQPFRTFHSLPAYRYCSGLQYPMWNNFTEDGWYNKHDTYNDVILLDCIKKIHNHNIDNLHSDFATKLSF